MTQLEGEDGRSVGLSGAQGADVVTAGRAAHTGRQWHLPGKKWVGSTRPRGCRFEVGLCPPS